MSTAQDVANAFYDARRDLHRLGECKKMLVSPQFFIAFRGLIIERAVNSGIPQPPFGEKIFFRGVPVVECDGLEDLEYAFVK